MSVVWNNSFEFYFVNFNQISSEYIEKLSKLILAR